MDNKFNLFDPNALEIYEQIEGLDLSDRSLPARSMKQVGELLDYIDNRRLLLLNLAYFLSSYFEKNDYYLDSKSETSTFNNIVNILKDLDGWYKHNRKIMIKYRGITDNESFSDNDDYAIHFGNIQVVSEMIPKILERSKETDEVHLSSAFKIFSQKGINNILITLPGNSKDNIKIFRRSLKSISHFNKAVQQIFSFVSGKKMHGNDLPIIFNENNQPDPNLTLLAVINNVDQSIFQNMVQKVRQAIIKAGPNASKQYISIYDALFGIKNLPINLVRAPIIINNVHLLLSESIQDGIEKEKAMVVKSIYKSFGGYSKDAHNSIESVYGDQHIYGNVFARQTSKTIHNRLNYAIRVIEQSQSHSNARKIEKEVSKNVGKRLERVSNEVLSELLIPPEIKEFREISEGPIKGTEIFFGTQSFYFQRMIDYFKQRCLTRNKMHLLIKDNIEFDEADCTIISREYNLPRPDVKHAIRLIKRCFEKNGNFNKSAYENLMQEFFPYRKFVFEFFWHMLKMMELSRRDRVTFLNSLQLLIERMDIRDKALKAILEDVFAKPTVISFSDRNAMILANILIRSYNKEKNVTIELTPEEVLLVDNGLMDEMLKLASSIIDEYQEIFIIKVVTIREMITKSLRSEPGQLKLFPVRFLLSLEREIYSFFSIVKGVTSCAIIRIAMNEYGNPQSELYHLSKKRNFLSNIFQHFRVIIRGFGRIGEKEDLPLLFNIIEKEKEFFSIDPTYQLAIRKIVELTHESIERINKKHEKPYKSSVQL